MNKIKNCLLSINRNKLSKNPNLENRKHSFNKSNIILNIHYSFSNNFNYKNNNLNPKKLERENILNNENFRGIRRHEKHSNFNNDLYNKKKIDPNDENFYGNKIKFLL